MPRRNRAARKAEQAGRWKRIRTEEAAAEEARRRGGVVGRVAEAIAAPVIDAAADAAAEVIAERIAADQTDASVVASLVEAASDDPQQAATLAEIATEAIEVQAASDTDPAQIVEEPGDRVIMELDGAESGSVITVDDVVIELAKDPSLRAAFMVALSIRLEAAGQ